MLKIDGVGDGNCETTFILRCGVGVDTTICKGLEAGDGETRGLGDEKIWGDTAGDCEGDDPTKGDGDISAGLFSLKFCSVTELPYKTLAVPKTACLTPSYPFPIHDRFLLYSIFVCLSFSTSSKKSFTTPAPWSTTCLERSDQ